MIINASGFTIHAYGQPPSNWVSLDHKGGKMVLIEEEVRVLHYLLTRAISEIDKNNLAEERRLDEISQTNIQQRSKK